MIKMEKKEKYLLHLFKRILKSQSSQITYREFQTTTGAVKIATAFFSSYGRCKSVCDFVPRTKSATITFLHR